MLPDISPFLHLRRFVSIAHHVPGRIRLRLDMAALAHLPKVDPAPFVDLVRRIRGVIATRVNAAALCVVVDYDARLIPPADWQHLLAGTPEEVERILTAHAA
ncbi:hypothetical protein ACI7BZ_09455 [Xanthobacter sp. AM11]|uniref:hypothetical protein n=1 Tax=Xanthobacter sp. AM11 TaxID=3380643 RepID=UPI0039BF6872